jgi:hypothetical protein
MYLILYFKCVSPTTKKMLDGSLKETAKTDNDFKGLWTDDQFKKIIK